MRGFGLLFALVLFGCATAEAPEVQCVEDAECFPGQCVDGICISPDLGSAPDFSVPDEGVEPEPDMEALPDEGGEPDLELDLSETCSPECGPNETCVAGVCESACSPTCVAPQVCTENGCEFPACTQVGDRCQGAQPEGFLCLVESGSNEGRCFQSCEERGSRSGCGAGQFCLAVNSTSDANYCVESECTSTAECGAQTCLEFLDDFGLCFPGGNLPEGSACTSSNNQCGQGFFCDTDGSSTAGVCRRLCDPFQVGSCGAQQACGELVTERQALCTNTLTSPPRAAFQSCSPAGSWCGDRTLCQDFGEGQAFCIPYCRPGGNDCSGLTPAALCDPYVGPAGLGLCLPECDPLDADSCGEFECIDSGPDAGLCRIPCSAGNVVQDCCNGTTPCTAMCVDNYCE